MMFELGIGLLVGGLLLLIAGTIGLLVAGFKTSPWWGLGILFIGPLVGLFFLFSHFKKAWRPVLYGVLGTIMMPASLIFAPQDPEFDSKLVGYLPFTEGMEITTESLPNFSRVLEIAQQLDVRKLRAGEHGEATTADETQAPREGLAAEGLPVMSFDPSKPLDPKQVSISVLPRKEKKASVTTAPAAVAAPVVEPFPQASMEERLMGKPQSMVSEQLGKPLGIGSKKGLVYWMYTDFIVTFDKNRNVVAVELELVN